MTEEHENFYRHSTVIVDETKDSFLKLLDFHLRKKCITLLMFIEINAHAIYHFCYNKYPCCQCPSGTRTETRGSKVLHQPQLDIFLDKSGKKLQVHNPQNRSAPQCCFPVNPNIQLNDLDFTLARFLLINFTTLVPQGSPERNALDFLVNSRNHSFAHAKEGKIPNSEFQKSMADVEMSLLVLAKVYGEEAETKQRLKCILKQPLNTTMCLQLQNTLLQQCQLEEKINQLLTEKRLPDCLDKDLSDLCITEGHDAVFEIWTKDDKQCAVWLKDGLETVNFKQCITGKNGKIHSLKIKNACLRDKGRYTVIVNDIERNACLDVKEYFTNNLQSLKRIEGETVEFTCEVIEDSLLARWSKDGSHLQNGGKYKIQHVGRFHGLFITNCDLNDAGNYTVSINNRSRTTLLNVKEYFTKNMERNIECTEGGNVELSCAVLEDNVSAVWKKNGSDVQQSAKYIIEDVGMTHKLSIIQADLQDAGEYTVMINNRIRSVSLQVKEIPAAIQQLSEKDKGLYLEIIKAGTETRYYIRIFIIGENGVGKTCLLRRLLGQPIEDVKSTDGVDIVHRCKIRLRDGQWVFDGVADKRKAILSRIRRAVKSKTSEHSEKKLDGQKILDTLGSASIQGKNIDKPKTLEESIIEKKTHRQSRTLRADERGKTEPSEQKESDQIKGSEENKENEKEGIRTNSVNIRQDVKESLPLHSKSSVSEDTLSHSSPSQVQGNPVESKLEKVLTKSILTELSEYLNDIGKVDIPDEVMVDCGFWDFAGQRDYYPTHPIFLNPNGVHLLVANIMKDIKQINTEVGYDKIGEYVDYWFDSVHSYRDMENKTQNSGDYLNPPVIVVCTGIDRCKNTLKKKENEFRQGLMSLLENENKKKHLRRICLVSNTEPSDADFGHLRQSIFQFGKEMKTFEEKLPLKWIQLERSLDIIRDARVNILSWTELTELTYICSILDENEIILFLKYQHKIGSIIFFESLKENIILNQKWLADAFRCLVSETYDSDITITTEWKMLEDTGKLEPVLIEKLFQKDPQLEFNKHQIHLLNVMELFGILVKLNTLLEDGQKHISSTYYMPCMVSKQASIAELKKVFSVENDKCKRTPWLCIEFAFMPFDFFNHILCYYISKYLICTEPPTKRVAIYHGMGVFYFDQTKSKKFVLCFSKNTIAIQLWQWGKEIEQAKYKGIIEELKSVVLRVKDKYEPRKVSYIIKVKCSAGNIHNSADRLSYKELVELKDKEYFCEEHSECHYTKDFFQSWFSVYHEEKMYVCVHGIDREESNLSVFNYLMGRSKEKVIVEESLRSTEFPEHAVVVFANRVDLNALKKESERLKTSRMTFDEINPPMSVIVSSENDTLTETKLQEYLKKIHLETVRVHITDEGAICIKLKNVEGVIEILKYNNMKIDGSKIVISVTYKCDHGTYWDHSLHRVAIPAPYKPPHLDKHVKGFLIDITSACNEHLKPYHACLSVSDEIYIKCTIDPKDKAVRSKVRVWKERVENAWQVFISRNVQKRELKVTSDTKDLLKEHINKTKEEHKSEELKVYEDNKMTFIFVGKSNVVNNFHEKVLAKKMQIQKNLNRNNRMRTDSMNLKPIEIALMSKGEKFQQLSQIASDFTYQVDEDNGTITFTGIQEDIDAAKLIIFETKNSFHTWNVTNMSLCQCRLLNNQIVRDLVNETLQANHISALFKIEQNKIVVSATSEKHFQQLEKVLKETILEEYIQLDESSKNVLMLDEWAQKKASIKNLFPDIVHIEDSANDKIVVTAWRTVITDIVNALNEFIVENSVYESDVKVSNEAELKFLEMHCMEDIKDLEYKNQNLTIEFHKQSVKVKGTKMATKEARDEINRIIRQIQKDQYTISKPGVDSLFDSQPKYDSLITPIEEESRTVILIAKYTFAKIPYHRKTAHQESDVFYVRKQGSQKHVIESKNTEVSSVTFMIYSMSSHDRDKAKKQLDKAVSDKYKTEHISERVISELRPKELEYLLSVEDRYPIKLEIDQSRSEVIIEGTTDHTINAKQDIFDCFRMFGHTRQSEAEEEIVKDNAQWYLKDKDSFGGLIPYPPKINMHLENAYKGDSNKSDVDFEDAYGEKYIINFKTMMEYPMLNPNDTVDVIRREKLEESGGYFEPPYTWIEQDTDNVKVVTLMNRDPEYMFVEKKLTDSVKYGTFSKTSPDVNGKTVVVTKIQRIQNLNLYRMYAAKQALMEKQNAKGVQNERELWHGTPENAVDSINLYGFNRSYCAANSQGACWGQGVYFATDASYSVRDFLTRPTQISAPQDICIYLCSVLTGVSRQGVRDEPIRCLPTRPDGTNLPYDSNTDNLKAPMEYVIFNDTQAYPLYCIKFQLK